MRFSRFAPALLACSCWLASCAPPSTQPRPTAPSTFEGPGAASNRYVSREPDTVPPPRASIGDDDEPAYDAAYLVTDPAAARRIAEDSVAGRLNPKQTWRTSPMLPASWPSSEKSVMFLFYPMAANPGSLSHYQLFSAAFRVRVSLVDGTAEVEEIAKRQKLGTVQEERASVLERSELELAEQSLVRVILRGLDDKTGENSFWGYLKYFHEHPKIARDIKLRAPKFVAWLQYRGKR